MRNRHAERVEAVNDDVAQLMHERRWAVVEHADCVPIGADDARHLAVTVRPVIVRSGAGAMPVEVGSVGVTIGEQHQLARVRPQLAAIERLGADAHFPHGLLGAVDVTPLRTPQNSEPPG